MKKIILLINMLLFTGSYCQAQTDLMQKVRTLYQKAATEEQACEQLIKLVEANNPKEDPLLLGYKGSATMMMANYVANPFAKLLSFNQGKKMLEQAVKADRNNVELRFLRYAAQKNAPSFLGYDEHIAADKAYLLGAIDSVDTSVRKLIDLQLNENKTD